jgi:hypothetical protein
MCIKDTRKVMLLQVYNSVYGNIYLIIAYHLLMLLVDAVCKNLHNISVRYRKLFYLIYNNRYISAGGN